MADRTFATATPGPPEGAGAGTVEIRTVAAEDFAPWLRAAVETFGEQMREGHPERFRERFDLRRAVGAYDGTVLVGTAASLDMQLTLPGGARASCAGISLVTVAPTHRRRGLLRRLLARLLDDALERGDAFSALYASEGGIYGRFGYGPAIPSADLVLADGARRLVDDPGRPATGVRLIDRGTAAEVIPHIFEECVARRPGALSRPHHLWSGLRGPGTGTHPERFAVVGPEGAEEGVVVYRAAADWQEGAPAVADGTLTVEWLIGRDVAAEQQLWRFLLGVDLMRRVVARGRPVDDPLTLVVGDRHAVRARAGEPVWLRLLDVPAALRARAYDADGAVVLGVRDAALAHNAGSWRLEVAGGAVAVERSRSAPDLHLEVADLAEVYLGRTAVRNLVAVGRVGEATPGAAATLDRLLSTWPAPWNPLHF